MSNLIPYAIAWGVVALIVLALAIMRKMIASHEDDTLHLGGDAAAVVSEQSTVARKLDAIDKWGKLLTVVLAVSGLALVGYYAYDVFTSSSSATFTK